jgi:hypothetical protein
MHLDLDFVCDGIAHVDLVDAEPGIELPEKRAFGLHPSDPSQQTGTRYKTVCVMQFELRK